jgi:2-polyprenyl-3-methyl-5-hydroxy-6-metoxy-1,4-benzoquinol methylase
MNRVDRFLQHKRIAEALRWMPPGGHVLDIGCADGALFRQARSLIKSGIGIDPDEPSDWPTGPYEFRQGTFPDALDGADRFDAIAMLAVIEHVPSDIRKTWFDTVMAVLNPGGRLIITVPAPAVDRLLDVGIRLHLLHGMDAESHHGFDPRVIPEELSTSAMRLLKASRFEMGLNHLFVYERTA